MEWETNPRTRTWREAEEKKREQDKQEQDTAGQGCKGKERETLERQGRKGQKELEEAIRAEIRKRESKQQLEMIPEVEIEQDGIEMGIVGGNQNKAPMVKFTTQLVMRCHKCLSWL